MKIIFLSAIVLIYGYFCDICRFICEKKVHRKLERDIPLTGTDLIFMSNLAYNSLLRWKRLEKRLIRELILKQNF